MSINPPFRSGNGGGLGSPVFQRGKREAWLFFPGKGGKIKEANQKEDTNITAEGNFGEFGGRR
jgi:hypothetical protein